MIDIILFRVPTSEILDELKYRIQHQRAYNFETISSEDLLKHILENRMTSFKY